MDENSLICSSGEPVDDQFVCAGGMYREKFNYKTSTKITLDKEYTIQELLDMKDDKFTDIYKIYEKDVENLVNTMSKPLGGLITPVFNALVNTMERIVLERRIMKLEK